MKLTRILFGVLIMSLLLLTACGEKPKAAAPAAAAPAAAKAEEKEEVKANAPTVEKPLVIRLGYEDKPTWPNGPAKGPDPEHAMGLVFKSIVEQRTGGAIKVELFPASAIGSSKVMTEMVQNDLLSAAVTTGPTGTFFPPFNLIYIPYLFQTEDIAWDFFDRHPFWAELTEKMKNETNIKVLAMGQNGVRNFTNSKRPIKTPADLKGLKFRVMENPIYVNMIKGMGGEAIPIAWAEVYTALNTGVVDGHENPIKIIELGSIYEVQKYLTIDGHVWSEDALIMSGKLYDSLPRSMQRIIKSAARQAALAGRAAETLGTKVTSLEVIKKHMEIYSPTADELRQFQEAAQPPVLAWLKEQIGEELVNKMLQAVAETEKTLGYR
jgi:C4-dicarboxylate-binding protein DctP